MKITALSSCCVDFFPELEKVYVGGNSLNFATQCKLSNITDISVMGAVGEDWYGDLIEQHLDKCNIDRSRLYRLNVPTASNRIYINEQGDRYFKENSWNGGAFDKFRLSEEDWLYMENRDIIAMPAGDPNLDSLLERRTQNQLVVIDFLDYHSIEFIEKRIEHIDIVFLSANENRFDSLKKLAFKSGKMIVATIGSEGSVAFYKDSIFRQEAIHVDKIIDTTGCGDAYQAAFMIEWFTSKDVKKAMLEGSLAASKVLSFIGGVE